MFHYLTGSGRGKLTQTAGTRIQWLMGGLGNLFTHINFLRVTTGATAHTITLMRGASRTTCATALAAAGTALVVAAALTDGAGNAIAANDFIGIRLDNGDWHLTSISAWDAPTLTATLTTAIPTGRSVLKGARVTCYGVAGDAMHSSYQLNSGAGATNNWPAVTTEGSSLVKATYKGEPIMIDIDNATNASTLEACSWGGTKF